jgi:hypothetical protein
METADAKENQASIPKAPSQSSTRDIVGSGSTWGERQRHQFRIQTVEEVIDVHQLIGSKWFEFTNLNRSQYDCISPLNLSEF